MEVMPSVCDLLTAGTAAPGGSRLPRGGKHVVIGHLVVRRIVRMMGQFASCAGSVGRRYEARRENAAGVTGQMVLILSSPRPCNQQRNKNTPIGQRNLCRAPRSLLREGNVSYGDCVGVFGVDEVREQIESSVLGWGRVVEGCGLVIEMV